MRRRRARIAAAGLAVCGIANVALASDWIRPASSGPGDWYSNSNWSPASVPINSADANISNGGTAQVGAGLAAFDQLYLGNSTGQSGTLSLVAGSLQPDGGAYVGYSGTGKLLQSDGTLTLTAGSNPGMYLGYNSGGIGTYQMSGGTLLLASNAAMYLGYSSGAKGFFSMSAGTLQSISSQPLLVGDNGTGSFSQSGGNITLSGSLYVGYNAAGTIDLSGGAMSSNSLWVGRASSGGKFTQSGGTNNTNSATIDSHGTYQLSAGTLNSTTIFLSSNAILSLTGGTINTRDLVPGSTSTVNLGIGTGALNYTGIVDLSSANLVGGTSTTVTGGPNSLLLLKPGFDPSLGFGSFVTSGLVHTVGSALTIPVGTSITGNATLTDHVFLDGTLSLGGLTGGVTISSTGSLTATAIYVRDQISGSSGNGTVTFTYIGDQGQVARFEQSGGNFHAGFLTLGPNASCLLSDGTLFLNSASVSGAIDFASGGGTLSASGITNVGGGTLINASSAHLVLADNSLLIVPTGFNPQTAFATTSIGASALVHTSGTTLEIPVGTSIIAPGILSAPINDFVHAAGTLKAWVPLAGGVAVDSTGSVDLTFGTLTVQGDSSNSGGALRVGQINVGDTGNGHFTQTGGSATFSWMMIGNKAGSNGTLTLNGGSLSGTIYAGYDGTGTVEQNGGSIGSVFLGENKTGIGSYHMAAGTISTFLYIGEFGVGTFIQDGANTFAPAPTVGDGTGSRGSYQFSAGTISAGYGYAGRSGVGTFIQSGGFLSPYSFDVGASTNSAGTFLFSNGTITSGIFPLGLTVGDSGSGFMRQTGGSITAGSLTVGYGPGSGTYELSGGTLSLQQMLIARQGHTISLFTQTGATSTITGSLSIASGLQAPVGTYNLQNGTLAVGSIVMGSTTGGGTASFNQSGGINTVQHELVLNTASRYTVSAGTFTAGTIQLNGGTLAVSPGYGGVVRVNGVTNSSGAVDLGDAALIVDYSGTSPIASLRQRLVTGYAGGAWNGAGIDSASAAAVGADSMNLHKTAVGFAEASTLNVGTFAGQSVDNSAVLIRYTFAGDANLDGTVNTADFALLAAHFGSSTQLWTDGDMNFDGVVNALDFNAVASNFGQALASPARESLVPEPAILTLTLLPMVMKRRRRLT